MKTIALCLAIAGCASAPTPAQQAAVTVDGVLQDECIRSIPDTACVDAGDRQACVDAQRARMDACRGVVKARRDGGAS